MPRKPEPALSQGHNGAHGEMGHPRVGSVPSPRWEEAQVGGKQRGRLLGGRSGHGCDPRPGTPVPPASVSQVPKSLWKHLNLKRSLKII